MSFYNLPPENTPEINLLLLKTKQQSWIIIKNIIIIAGSALQVDILLIIYYCKNLKNMCNYNEDSATKESATRWKVSH